jgi:RNA polymerase sigma factor (sigma-70 family)
VGNGGSPMGPVEMPTAAARLVIILVPDGDLQTIDDLRGLATSTVAESSLGFSSDQREVDTTRRSSAAVDPQFATCYQAEMPALIGFLLTCGATRYEAADVAQEAFIELFEHWQAVRNPKSWLRTVAFRFFLRRPASSALPLTECQEAASQLSISSRFDFREEEQFVLNVFRLLPTAQRAVLALHYDQFETREIADILNMNKAAVRKNLERARATLKEFLDRNGNQLRSVRSPDTRKREGGDLHE